MKILCLPGYLQNGSTLAVKSSGLRKILTKKLGYQLDFIDPLHTIKSRKEFSFPLASTEEESDKVWDSIVEKGNNRRWFDHEAPGINHGLDASIEYLVNHIKENGPYDCIIGFSQGSAMAIMITNSIRRLLPNHPDFKISLFISCFCLTEPKTSDHSDDNRERINELEDVDQFKNEVKLSENVVKYTIPPSDLKTQILIVYGKEDNIVPPVRSKYVGNYYKDPIYFEHESGHLIPNKKDFLQPIVKLFEESANKSNL
ncbi:unnamed protein product [Candida verbasci]|uniref:Serine hydrolase domain-containing protein n=1 Tax=Candida verbasci TaxID=1227364 RepID=A0A9W4TVT3_9ASCO|nr:unnamed protein product [Candida verbasci]